MPDPLRGATCPHRRPVLDGRPTGERVGTVGTRMRQTGTCLDCGCSIERLTPVVEFGPWQTIAVRGTRRPRDEVAAYRAAREAGRSDPAA